MRQSWVAHQVTTLGSIVLWRSVDVAVDTTIIRSAAESGEQRHFLFSLRSPIAGRASLIHKSFICVNFLERNKILRESDVTHGLSVNLSASNGARKPRGKADCVPKMDDSF
jgi:hypothetical protein